MDTTIKKTLKTRKIIKSGRTPIEGLPAAPSRRRTPHPPRVAPPEKYNDKIRRELMDYLLIHGAVGGKKLRHRLRVLGALTNKDIHDCIH